MANISVNKLMSGTVVIRIPKSALKRAVVHMPKLEEYDDESGDCLIPKITDTDAFVDDFFPTLNDEEEDGTTPVYEMIDKVALTAIENGADGIVFPGDKGYGRKAVAG
jgi:hypothetical protein